MSVSLSVTTDHRQALRKVWLELPHLAYAFADYTHFECAATAHQAAHRERFLDVAIQWARSDAASADVAARRIALARNPAKPMAGVPVIDRHGGRLIIWLYGVIGPDPAPCNADAICGALEEHADASAVVLRIASAGGVADTAARIVDALAFHKARTVAVVDKYAFSAASRIAAACDKILMRSDACWMMHRAHTTATGNIEALDRARSLLAYADVQAVRTYASKRRISIARAREALNAGKFLSAIQAVNAGLADHIIPALPIDWGAEQELTHE